MEDEMYGVATTAEYSEKALMTPENIFPAEYHSFLMSSGGRIPMFGSDEFLSAAVAEPYPSVAAPEIQRQHDASSLIKARIASHPHYPRLLEAYIDCQKETYCDMLVKYKSDLTRPFDEATTFLSKIETQLSDLCTGSSLPTLSDDGGVSSEEGLSAGDGDAQDQLRGEDRELKDRLLRKFGSHIGSLKMEFSKKKKRGKLPKDARQTLLQWWNIHYKWPYPTEGDKIALAKSTGLDQKQINNWFINQRKRHWKPSENMPFSMVDGLTGRFLTDE